MPSSDHTHEPETSAGVDGIPTSVAEAESDASSPPGSIVSRGSTFEAFKHRAYVLFWTGALVSNVGTWMQTAAISILVYGLRGSEADSGIVTFITQIPTLFLALPGGVLADRVDKRRLIIGAQWLLMLQALALGILYATGRLSPAAPVSALVWMSGLGLVAGVLTALSFPAWQTIIPDLVPRPLLLNAIALNSAQFQSARMLGPLAATAVLLAGLGMADIFWINAASFLFVIGAVWAVRTLPHAVEAPKRPHEGVWASLKAGVGYTVTHRMIGIVIASTAMMSVFALPYVFLMPAVADKVLGYAYTSPDNARITAVLLAANGLGALVGALVVASLPHTIRRERLMRWSILATALLLVVFAFTKVLSISVALSALCGAAVLTTNSLANTSVQANVPDHLRGRVMSVFIMSFMGLMPLSAAAFGPIAEGIGPAWAIAGGALVLLAWALVLIARPALLTADGDDRKVA